MKVEIRGINELVINSRLAAGALRREFHIALRQATKAIWKRSRERVRTGYSKAPYDTGDMMRSIKKTVRPWKGTVRPTVDYAIYPHEGWSTSSSYGPRPFMTDAVMDEKKEIEDIFERRINNVLRMI